MYPNITELNLPWGVMPIRSFGIALMIAFLGGVWWSCKRAVRVKADPDLIINIALIGLIAAVVGARTFYVLHYWEKFEGKGVGAIFSITEGGFEFYGSFIGIMIATTSYLLWKGVSLRLYLDILAPSLMFGLAVGRIGCFVNGCCWGGVCAPELPWAVRFPYASNAYIRQWEERLLTVPAELIYTPMSGNPSLLNPIGFDVDPTEYNQRREAYAEAQRAEREAKQKNKPAAEVAALAKRTQEARASFAELAKYYNQIRYQASRMRMSEDELRRVALGSSNRSLHVHPVQLYAAINAALIAAIMNTYFYRRKRHGMVACLFWFMYPVARFIEEAIRTDNPRDTAGLTVSQFVSVCLLMIGVAWYITVKRLPLHSPKLDRPGPAKGTKAKA